MQEVAHAIGMDRRIGKQFLQASVGFGGIMVRLTHTLHYLRSLHRFLIQQPSTSQLTCLAASLPLLP